MRITDELFSLDCIKGKDKSNFNVEKAIDETFINIDEEVGMPPFCLSFIQGSEPTGIFTLGDFSVIAGQPKSRKSLFRSMITAAAINNEDDICGMIRCQLPEGKQGVLVIDSEQSKYHAHKAVKRAMKLAGKQNDPLFRSHRLREYSPEERKEILEILIVRTPELGFVVIDGIADFVNSVNDEAECRKTADWLDKVSSKYHCHIVCVIHENKGSIHMRGHLGSELQRKAQAVISVTREDEEASIVSARDMRDLHFAPFAIGYDENNNPTIFHDYEILGADNKRRNNNRQQKEPKMRLNQYSESEHIGFLNKIFRALGVDRIRNSVLKVNVRHVYGENFYKQDANDCAQFFLDNGLLEKIHEPFKGTAGIYYQLTDKVRKATAPFYGVN